MSITNRSRPNLFISARVRVATLLLVGALLLCHGLFGALHLCSDTPSASADHHGLHEHQATTGVGESAPEHQVCHLMHAANYYAVFLGALLGLALGLLVKGFRFSSRYSTTLTYSRMSRPVVLHPPRGPTSQPLLQVFRL
jgi:hypothetical protein